MELLINIIIVLVVVLFLSILNLMRIIKNDKKRSITNRMRVADSVEEAFAELDKIAKTKKK